MAASSVAELAVHLDIRAVGPQMLKYLIVFVPLGVRIALAEALVDLRWAFKCIFVANHFSLRVNLELTVVLASMLVPDELVQKVLQNLILDLDQTHRLLGGVCATDAAGA